MNGPTADDAPRRLTLVVNPGRSGSTHLASLLRAGAPELYVDHEALDKYAAQPNRYQRAWESDRADAILARPAIARQVDRWRAALERGPVVETGWTAAHLGPVLHRAFGASFAVILLHRHPVLQAASRAVQGMYADAWRDRDHELDPFHERALYPAFRERWPRMTPFERCLYVWLEITAQGIELRDRLSQVPFVELPARDLFERRGAFEEAIRLIGADPDRVRDVPAAHNPVQTAGREEWPLGGAWRCHRAHPEVQELGARLGYEFNDEDLSHRLARYQRPRGAGPWLRSVSGYHPLKRSLSRRVPEGPLKDAIRRLLRRLGGPG